MLVPSAVFKQLIMGDPATIWISVIPRSSYYIVLVVKLMSVDFVAHCVRVAILTWASVVLAYINRQQFILMSYGVKINNFLRGSKRSHKIGQKIVI